MDSCWPDSGDRSLAVHSNNAKGPFTSICGRRWGWNITSQGFKSRFLCPNPERVVRLGTCDSEMRALVSRHIWQLCCWQSVTIWVPFCCFDSLLKNMIDLISASRFQKYFRGLYETVYRHIPLWITIHSTQTPQNLQEVISSVNVANLIATKGREQLLALVKHGKRCRCLS